MKIVDKFRQFKWWFRMVYRGENHKGHMEKIKVKVPYFTKLRYNILGFTDYQYLIYDLKRNSYKEYINTPERYRLEKINNERRAMILNDKVMFERIFGQYINVAHVHFWVKDGQFLDLEGGFANPIKLVKVNKMMAKPTSGLGGGTGVTTIYCEDNKYFVGEVSYNEKDFIEHLSTMEEYLFTPYLINHEYAHRIYSRTANTLRMITILDGVEADLVLAVHRFGTEASYPVDNVASGGICSNVDLNTGIMSEAKDYFHIGESYSVHPDSGEKIEGEKVPYWDKLKEYVINAHKCFPFFDFLAWDIMIADDGKFYVLEINRGSEMNFLQLHQPLKNSPLGEYMRKKEIIR